MCCQEVSGEDTNKADVRGLLPKVLYFKNFAKNSLHPSMGSTERSVPFFMKMANIFRPHIFRNVRKHLGGLGKMRILSRFALGVLKFLDS